MENVASTLVAVAAPDTVETETAAEPTEAEVATTAETGPEAAAPRAPRKEKIASARSATELLQAFEEYIARAPSTEGAPQTEKDRQEMEQLADEVSRRYRADRSKHDKWADLSNVLGAKSMLVALEGAATDESINREMARYKKLIDEDTARAASLARLREAAKRLGIDRLGPKKRPAAPALPTEETATASVGALVRMVCSDEPQNARIALDSVCDALHVLIEATSIVTR